MLWAYACAIRWAKKGAPVASQHARGYSEAWMSAPVLTALRAFCLSALALCAAMFAVVRTAAAQPVATSERASEARVEGGRGPEGDRISEGRGQPEGRAQAAEEPERGDAVALSACSLDVAYASFWAASSLGDTASVPPQAAEPSIGCNGVLDDPLTPAPLCDPSATTGVAAAYVRSVADDRLEAVQGCGDGELDAQSWLGEREPDPASWQQSSLEPAHLSGLADARARAASMDLPESPYPGHSSEGISMNIERPPMRR